MAPRINNPLERCFNLPAAKLTNAANATAKVPGQITLYSKDETYVFFLAHLGSYSVQEDPDQCTLTLHFPTHLVSLRGPPLLLVAQDHACPHWTSEVLCGGGEWSSPTTAATATAKMLTEIRVRRQPG